jgi:hypothetical protein
MTFEEGLLEHGTHHAHESAGTRGRVIFDLADTVVGCIYDYADGRLIRVTSSHCVLDDGSIIDIEGNFCEKLECDTIGDVASAEDVYYTLMGQSIDVGCCILPCDSDHAAGKVIFRLNELDEDVNVRIDASEDVILSRHSNGICINGMGPFPAFSTPIQANFKRRHPLHLHLQSTEWSPATPPTPSVLAEDEMTVHSLVLSTPSEPPFSGTMGRESSSSPSVSVLLRSMHASLSPIDAPPSNGLTPSSAQTTREEVDGYLNLSVQSLGIRLPSEWDEDP